MRRAEAAALREPVVPAREVVRLVVLAVFAAAVFVAAFGFVRDVEAAFDDALLVEEEPARLALRAAPLDFDLDCAAELRA